MRKLITDIAIIGAGAAGIPAAIKAAEAGVKVDVFDQADHTGGGCNGGNGVFAVETDMQKERQIPYTKKQILDFWMDYTHNLVDAHLVSEYINRSAGTVKWLQSNGVIFNDLVAYFKGAHYVWHFRKEGSPFILDLLKPVSEEKGVIYHLSVNVKKLTLSDGKITGFIAEDKEGEIKVEAKSVIIASGGVGKHRDFVKKHTGKELGTEISCFPGMLYDEGEKMPRLGVELAWETGAVQTDFMIDAYASIPDPNFGPGGCPVPLGDFRQPYNIMVNLHGERFISEETMKNGSFMGNAIDIQKEHTGFMIYDTTIREHYKHMGWEYVISNPPPQEDIKLEEYIKRNNDDGNFDIIIADSLEELCEKMGISHKLIETVEKYNKDIELFGFDPLFYKDNKYLIPLKGPKYYCAKFRRHAYGVMGGLKINYRTEVQDNFGDSIPGLYAAGNDANTIYGNSYPFTLSGNTSGFAINTGLMAGENAAEYVKNLQH